MAKSIWTIVLVALVACATITSDVEASTYNNVVNNVINPIHKVSGFNVFGDTSFTATGYFDYVSSNMRMPLNMYLDVVNQRLVVNHTTTYHYVNATHAFICLKQMGAWVCYNTPEFTFAGWIGEYNNTMYTGDSEDLVFTPLGPAIKYFGKTRDQHVSYNKNLATLVYKVQNGRRGGVPAQWDFELAFCCNVQSFSWIFDEINVNTPPSDVFNAPSFVTNVSALPLYSTFACNLPCTFTPPPPCPTCPPPSPCP